MPGKNNDFCLECLLYNISIKKLSFSAAPCTYDKKKEFGLIYPLFLGKGTRLILFNFICLRRLKNTNKQMKGVSW